MIPSLNDRRHLPDSGLYLIDVASLDIPHPFDESVHQRETDICLEAAFHVELLVLLLEPHVLEDFHDRVHAHVAECYLVSS